MKAILCSAIIGGCYLLAGTMDYNDKASAAQEQKYLNQGRIWSKKCEKQGKDVIATKADNGKWKVACIEKRTLRVSL